jgi:hypothetical protein
MSANVDFGDVEEAKAFLKAFRRCQEEPKTIEHEPMDFVEEGSLISDGWHHDTD